MTLEELIAQYRQEANDKGVAVFFDDQSIIGLLNNAVNEACVRARLIHESVDPDIVDMAVAAEPNRVPATRFRVRNRLHRVYRDRQ